MEIEVFEDRKDSLVFSMKGEQHTFPALLCWALSQDKNVVSAVYVVDHPLVGQPKIHIQTKGTDPRKAINTAIKLIELELESINKSVAKVAKK